MFFVIQVLFMLNKKKVSLTEWLSLRIKKLLGSHCKDAAFYEQRISTFLQEKEKENVEDSGDYTFDNIICLLFFPSMNFLKVDQPIWHKCKY